MSGMLHPVGPEPARTYWIRRGVLAAVVLLLALGVVVTVANLTKAAVVTAPPPAVLPVDSPSPSMSASSATGAGPSAAGPSAAATPGSPPSTAASGATPGVAASASTQPIPRSSAPASTSPSTNPSAGSSTNPIGKPSPATTTVGTPNCKPAELRVTLKGDRSLKPGQNNTFALTLINGGKQTCLTSVTDKNFELKVYSGKDRIWSSRDCSKTLADFDKLLAAQADVDWKMTWNGERSVKGATCKTGPETPQAGTYWATAQLRGADPVQLRMIIS